MLTKPVYISISEGSRIYGSLGHSSAIFKRPIVEGDYYLEVVVKEDVRKDKKTIHPPSVRVGICTHTYNPAFPLGLNESICYKSIDGTIYKDSIKIQTCTPYGVGDTLGVLLKIGPRDKHPN